MPLMDPPFRTPELKLATHLIAVERGRFFDSGISSRVAEIASSIDRPGCFLDQDQVAVRPASDPGQAWYHGKNGHLDEDHLADFFAIHALLVCAAGRAGRASAL